MKIKNPKKILSKKEPEKKLLRPMRSKAGRGNSGRITVRHRGGGVKRKYRIIDFGQEMLNIQAEVKAIEYNPNSNSFICLLEYENKEKRYQICPNNLQVGDIIICSEKAETKKGNRMKLKNIPVGTEVYNIEVVPGKGGKLIRGAGTSARVLTQEGKFTHLILPSSEEKKFFSECYASIGQVSFPEYKFIKKGKAGKSRLIGKRPAVRGVAMNPVDHPHGGGEGRSPIGMKYPKTPSGKPALGPKTRKKKWTDRFIIKRRKKKGRRN